MRKFEKLYNTIMEEVIEESFYGLISNEQLFNSFTKNEELRNFMQNHLEQFINDQWDKKILDPVQGKFSRFYKLKQSEIFNVLNAMKQYYVLLKDGLKKFDKEGKITVDEAYGLQPYDEELFETEIEDLLKKKQ